MRQVIYSTKRIGEPSSKYGYQPELFEQDVRKHQEEAEQRYFNFLQWVHANEMTPEQVRQLFIRFYDDYIKERNT